MDKQAKIALGAIAIVVVLVGGSFAVATSADAAVPGDMLYGIDRSYENVQMALKTSPEAKADFEVDLLEERADELSVLEESDGEADLIEEAVDNLEEQDENVQTRIRDAEDNETSDEGELERIRSRYEEQLQYNYQLMEKLQEKYQIKEEGGDDSGQQGGADEETGTGSGLSDESGSESGAGTGDGGSDSGSDESGSGSKSLDDKINNYKSKLEEDLRGSSGSGGNGSGGSGGSGNGR